MAVSNTMLHW